MSGATGEEIAAEARAVRVRLGVMAAPALAAVVRRAGLGLLRVTGGLAGGRADSAALPWEKAVFLDAIAAKAVAAKCRSGVLRRCPCQS
jgi:hypothetical protein